jgi:hypothetical protein
MIGYRLLSRETEGAPEVGREAVPQRIADADSATSLRRVARLVPEYRAMVQARLSCNKPVFLDRS